MLGQPWRWTYKIYQNIQYTRAMLVTRQLPESSPRAREGQCHFDWRWHHSTPRCQYSGHPHGASSACCEVRRCQNPSQQMTHCAIMITH